MGTMPSCGVCGLFVLLSVCLISLTQPCEGGNILVYPLDGSHWINMKILLEELHARGHNITVVRASTSWYIAEESPLYKSITLEMEEESSENFFDSYLKEHMRMQREGASLLSFFKLTKEFLSIATGVVLAKFLKLPTVLNVRWITSGDGQFALAPSPISYIPVPGSGLTDKINFMQRVKNLFFYGLMLFQQSVMIGPTYDAICHKYIEGGCDIISLLQEADIWLFRSDFVFDYPRPTMPNVVYIGGFQCKPAQPLPADLERFVQSAGEHGVIIMTLGTLINGLPQEVAEEIASVFAKMPQKVIWRHKGMRPSTVGNNTLIVDWMPQKDLLGHPQTKVFIAHGGTNGVQEAIYHGVPVLGIPLFFDQFDNLLRLQDRGAAKIIQLADVNGHSLEQGLKEVLLQDSYRQHMQRLSRLHRDQPVAPMDQAIFWVEYVMRHKGAAHLRTEANKMPWYSYHSLDVLLLLLTAAALLVLSALTIFWLLCCRSRRKTKSKQH
uniref:UDP-glucuronosyltransferase n=1 Tax=Scophthalmus maximus TaxID=52904 RepID=A0A8D3DA98_SCOMX